MWAERPRPRRGPPRLLSTTRACSTRDALAFFAQAAPDADRALWLRPETSEAIVGVGAALVLESDQADPFGSIDRQWRELLAEADIDGPGPRLLGGFSFDPRRARTRLWSGFPAARFVLPSRMLTLRDGVAWLTTNVVHGETSPTRVPEPLASSTGPLSRAAWTELVASVASAIGERTLDLEKVVLARAHEVSLGTEDASAVRRSALTSVRGGIDATPVRESIDVAQMRPSIDATQVRESIDVAQVRPGIDGTQVRESIDITPVLATLAARYPSCTVFAFDHGGACFVGATPERLVALHGGTASSMALAGSVSRGATPTEDAALAAGLLANPKERSEHAFVVNALRDGLAADGLCTSVVASAEPSVRQLPNVQHLFTPIRGQVADGTTVLDLVARLHPTPAVGGSPTPGALELIRAREGLDRGWYAGALGWVDARGEGDFVVGIRSALLRGETATLFAGCGIVAESDAEAEFRESEWKLQPMLSALVGADVAVGR